MIGIKFNIPNEYNNFLGKILENINIEKGLWRVLNEEVFNENGINLFSKETYSDSEFKNLINNQIYYPVFLTLQLYEKMENISDIKNYNNYLESDCKLILYIIDNEFVEVYSKNKAYLEIIRSNAKKNNFNKIKNIIDESEFSLYY